MLNIARPNFNNVRKIIEERLEKRLLKKIASLVMIRLNLTLNYHQIFNYATINNHSFLFKNNKKIQKMLEHFFHCNTDMQCNF